MMEKTKMSLKKLTELEIFDDSKHIVKKYGVKYSTCYFLKVNTSSDMTHKPQEEEMLFTQILNIMSRLNIILHFTWDSDLSNSLIYYLVKTNII